MRSRYLVILLSVMSLSYTTKAQKGAAGDTVIKGATIEIIQSYKPEVQRAPKPEWVPGLPPVDTSTPRLQYNVPPQTLYYSYSSLPLRPLALDISTEEKPFANYVKLGGGNLSTLYLDAGIGSLKGENYETAIHLQHLSQSGNIANQQTALTGADANGTLHHNGKAFGAKLGVHNNSYHYYGYDHDVYNYNKSAVSQAFTSVNLDLDMRDELAAGKDFNYHPTIGVGYYADKFSSKETTFRLGLPFSYKIDTNTQLYLDAHATITGYNSTLGTQSNNIFSIAPGIRFNREILSGHAAIAPTWGNNGSLYILPDIDIHFTLPETQFMFNVGWKGSLQQNTFQQLSTQNPYMYSAYRVQQSHNNEVFGGIKSNIGNHISFSGRISWWSYNNLPVFINDTATDKKQFFVLYDNKVNAIGLQAAIRYQVAQTFSIGFSGQWLNYYQTTFAKVWHRPGVRFTGDIMAQPVKKLTINGYISFIDELYALDNGNRTFKLNSILDIGVGAEYELIKRLSVFVQANNLLNNKYQLYYGYNAFGMNIYGGARFKF